jgi:hypothetical protein
MKARLYSAHHIPFVHDADAYRKMWTVWWVSCQPPWRREGGWPLPRERGTETNWGKLSARGNNGIFLVIMSTTWWLPSLKSVDDKHLFDEAVDDVRWVIEQTLNPPPGSDNPNTTQNLTPLSSTPKPVPSAATWLAHADGKRQAKPSRRLLEKLT